MTSGFSYKDLLNKNNQQVIRERLLAVNKKSGHSIPIMAKEMEISPTTLRRFLVEEKDAIYSVISKILGWVEHKESQLNG